MTYREVQGSLNKDFFETLIEDILAHSESPTYEVLYISVQPDSKYDYKTTCENFDAVDKDPAYLKRCLIQSSFESKFPSSEFFPNPQPFKTVRIPKETRKQQSTP